MPRRTILVNPIVIILGDRKLFELVAYLMPSTVFKESAHANWSVFIFFNIFSKFHNQIDNPLIGFQRIYVLLDKFVKEI